MDNRHDVSALVAQLTGEGILDSEGRFSLDPCKAVEKARNLRFTDPGQYLRCLYRGAVLGEATRFDVSVDSTHTVLTFDGPPLSHSQLRHLTASLYVEDDSYCGRKLQQLAMGLNGCWPQGYAQAEIHSPGVAFRYLPDQAEPIRIDSEPRDDNQIRLKRKFGPQVVTRFLTSNFAEEQVFLKGMGWSAVTTHFNGSEMARNRCGQSEFRLDTSLPTPMHLRSWGSPKRLDLPGVDVEFSLVLDLGEPSLPGRFHLIVGDVEAGEYPLPNCPGMDATVAVGPLRLDASQRQPVQNAEFKRMLGWLQAAWMAASLERLRFAPALDPLSVWSHLQRPDLFCSAELQRRFKQIRLVNGLWPEAKLSLEELRGRKLIAGLPARRRREAVLVQAEAVALLQQVGLPVELAADTLAKGPLSTKAQRQEARPLDFTRLHRTDQSFYIPMPEKGGLCFDFHDRTIAFGSQQARWAEIREITAEESWNGRTLFLVIVTQNGSWWSFRQDLRDPTVRRDTLDILEKLLARLEISHRSSWWLTGGTE